MISDALSYGMHAIAVRWWDHLRYGTTFDTIMNIINKWCHHNWLRTIQMMSRSHGAKHSPPGHRWPPDSPEGVSPAAFPGFLLTCDISGSSSSNNSRHASLSFVDALSYGMHAIAVRWRDHLRPRTTYDKIQKMSTKTMSPELTQDHPGDVYLQSAVNRQPGYRWEDS